MSSVAKQPSGKWRARYRDESGRERARHFDRKADAQRWLDVVTTSKMTTGNYVDPKVSATQTVKWWAEQWKAGRDGIHRHGTQRNVNRKVDMIVTRFGARPLSSIRPSDIKTWMSELRTSYAPATVTGVYRILVLFLADAVRDGLIQRSPCSRHTSPGAAKQKPYVASTAQVWDLYEAMAEQHRIAVLLGAFAGLRTGEVCGLRWLDVDLDQNLIIPAVQYPCQPLKTEMSGTAIPIPGELSKLLREQGRRWPGATVLTTPAGGQLPISTLGRPWRTARDSVDGLPAGFRFHDLRHWFASTLIASGADVKVVQARLRHASAVVTLDVYGHLFPDSDESTRTALSGVFRARADSVRTRLRVV
jgi:integrase